MIWRLNEAGIDDILVVDNLASSEKWRNLVNRRYRDYVHRDEFRRMVLEGRAPQKVEAIIHMGACSSTTERNADFLMDNNLHYSQMGQDFTLRQQTFFFVKDSMQQIICIDNAFHQNIRSTLTNNTYSLTRRLIGILYMHRTDVLRIFLQCRIFFKNRRVANHQELRNPFFQRTGNGVFRIGVISTNYCNTFPFVQGFQV